MNLVVVLYRFLNLLMEKFHFENRSGSCLGFIMDAWCVDADYVIV